MLTIVSVALVMFIYEHILVFCHIIIEDINTQLSSADVKNVLFSFLLLMSDKHSPVYIFHVYG